MYKSRTKEQLEITSVDLFVKNVEEFKKNLPLDNSSHAIVEDCSDLPAVKSSYTNIEFDLIIEEHRKLYDLTVATSVLCDGCLFNIQHII
jgi:hypothetical protein